MLGLFCKYVLQLDWLWSTISFPTKQKQIDTSFLCVVTVNGEKLH